jgi:hypothetical protein
VALEANQANAYVVGAGHDESIYRNRGSGVKQWQTPVTRCLN